MRIRIARFVLVGVFAIVPGRLWGSCEPYPVATTLALHIVEADFSEGCDLVGTDFECDDIRTASDGTGMHFAFVLATHVTQLYAVEFGVAFDTGVDVLMWNACGTATMLATPAWPDSGEGTAIAFAPPNPVVGPDSIAVVGYLLVAAGAEGEMRLTTDPRTGDATVIDVGSWSVAVPDTLLGSSEVGSSVGGTHYCGTCDTSAGPTDGELPTSDASWSRVKDVFLRATPGRTEP